MFQADYFLKECWLLLSRDWKCDRDVGSVSPCNCFFFFFFFFFFFAFCAFACIRMHSHAFACIRNVKELALGEYSMPVLGMLSVFDWSEIGDKEKTWSGRALKPLRSSSQPLKASVLLP